MNHLKLFLFLVLNFTLITSSHALSTSRIKLNKEVNGVIFELSKSIENPILKVKTKDSDFINIEIDSPDTENSNIFNFNNTDELVLESNFELEYLKRTYLSSQKSIIAVNKPLNIGGVVSRNIWNDNESLGYLSNSSASLVLQKYGDQINDLEIEKVELTENGRYLTWPLEYAKYIRGIVIHHTATTKDLDNPELAVKNIYEYHTKYKKWGDIGYHYLIAPDGTIFEGRKGGRSVIGGHALPVNKTTIGIAVLGNYQDDEPTEAVLASIIKLSRALSVEYGIEPDKKYIYKRQAFESIMGHRDNDNTACPGEKLYAKIPYIRTQATLPTSKLVRSFPSFLPIIETEYENLDFKITLQNISKNTFNKKQTYLKILDSNQKIEIENDVSSFKTFKVIIKANNLQPGLNSVKFNLYINGKKDEQEFNQIIYRRIPPLKFESKYIDSETIEIINKSKTQINSDNLQILTESGKVLNGTYSNLNLSSGKKVLFKSSEIKEAKSLRIVGKSELKILNQKLLIPLQEKKIEIDSKKLTQAEIINNNEFEIRFKNTLNSTLNINNLTFRFLNKSLGEIELITKNKTVQPDSFIDLRFKTEKNINESYKIPYFAYNANTKINKSLNFITFKDQSSNTSFQQLNSKINTNTPKSLQTPTIKVLLSNVKLNKFEINNSEEFNIITDKGVSKVNSVKVFRQGEKFKIQENGKIYLSKNLKLENKNGIFEITNYENRPTWNTKLNDNQFRGNFIFKYLDGEIKLINEINLEQYLKGLGEVSNSAEEDKIKTIMVAARSYAYYYLAEDRKFNTELYDLDDSPERSQKYLGYGLEKRSPNVAKAVDETKGEIVTFNGKNIKVPYFNQSNGQTKSALEVWGWKNTPYLESVDDSFCKNKVQNGHGVGISGCGASGMAEENYNYKDIIKYFLKDVQINKLY